MIESIEHMGELYHGCTLPGETREDGVYPGHFNGIQISATRFLLVYATRGFRGVDEDRSVVYQLRRDAYDGPVLAEGFVARAADDWDVLGDGVKHPRYYGSPIVFGVPKGVNLEGSPTDHANCFAVICRCNPRQLAADGTLVKVPEADPEFFNNLHMQWAQYRLNDAEDDLEIVSPLEPLCPKGKASYRDVFGEDATTFNVPMVEPQPIDATCRKWAMCVNVGALKHEKLSMIELAWDEHARRYQWTQTGPSFGDGLTEACVMRYRDEWLIAARVHGRPHAAWFWTRDLFSPMPDTVYPEHPRLVGPHTAYVGADGEVYVFGAPIDIDPGNRNPLCVWQIDPDRDFAMVQEHTVCNVSALGILTDLPHGEMAKLLPHTGGRVQYVLHRIRTRYTRDASRTGRVIRADEMEACGQYYAKIAYDADQSPRWRFDNEHAGVLSSHESSHESSRGSTIR